MADLTLQAFVEKWSKSTLSERSAYQQHFLDLCRMLGQKSPAEVDPEGNFYTFEKGIQKTGGSGGKGFADVWRKGFFAFEYKGKHKDLAAAYSQLLLYREDLENPPLLVVTDMDPVIRCYTPRGEEIRVVNVRLYTGTETLLLQGVDQQGNSCDVIVQPQSAQLVLKLITPHEPVPEPQRKPVEFPN